MKAMVITDFGGVDVFEERDVPKPTPSATGLVVKVVATSVNPVDCKMRAANWWGGTPPTILGFDVAGVVEAVGDAVRGFSVGDEVFYSPVLFGSPGSYAEYHAVEADIVVPKPKGLSFAEAAALPLAGCTAYEAIMMRLSVRAGESVLIHAAAGGVGSLAVQIAKACGAFVIGTASSRSVDFVKSLGADVVVDYKKEDFVEAVNAATGGAGVHATFDTVGGDTVARSTKCTRPYGRLCSITNVNGGVGSLIFKNQTLVGEFFERTKEKMEGLRVLAERGLLKPIIHKTMALSEVPQAHELIDKGGVKGKICIAVADP